MITAFDLVQNWEKNASFEIALPKLPKEAVPVLLGAAAGGLGGSDESRSYAQLIRDLASGSLRGGMSSLQGQGLGALLGYSLGSEGTGDIGSSRDIVRSGHHVGTALGALLAYRDGRDRRYRRKLENQVGQYEVDLKDTKENLEIYKRYLNTLRRPRNNPTPSKKNQKKG